MRSHRRMQGRPTAERGGVTVGATALGPCNLTPVVEEKRQRQWRGAVAGWPPIRRLGGVLAGLQLAGGERSLSGWRAISSGGVEQGRGMPAISRRGRSGRGASVGVPAISREWWKGGHYCARKPIGDLAQ